VRRAAAFLGPALAAIVLVGGLVACGTASGSPSGAPPSAAAASSPADDGAPTEPLEAATDEVGATDDASASVVPESPVAGVIVGIDTAGGGKVDGFLLRTNESETIFFKMGTLENAADFPPDSIQDHQTTASPILVFFHQEQAALVVYRIEDAG
jgi:hypothetical protein